MTNCQALKVLGFSGTVVVTQAEVKRKYRLLSKVLHPDLATGSMKAFIRLKDAYGIAMGIREGSKFDLDEVYCSIEQGSSLFSYVVGGQSYNFSYD